VSCPTTTFCAVVDTSGYATEFGPVVVPPVVSQLTWDTNGTLALVLGDSDYDYVYGPSAAPVEQINLTTSTSTYLTYSPSNSTWVTTNEGGDETGFYGFDTFGTLAFGTPTSAFGYAGEYADAASGFSNMRARFYNAQTGSFTTRDPDFNTTDTAYTYAGGDAINGVDPTGLCNSGVENGYYPGPCATTAAQSIAAAKYIQSHISSGGWNFTRAWHSEVNYWAGVANGVVSTVTFGQVHVSAPYCNALSWAYATGSGIGFAASAVGGGAFLESLGGASDAASISGEVSGDELPPAVIGEGMAARVVPFAEANGFETYAGIENPLDYSPEDLLADNRAHIETWMNEGRTIYDIGPEPGQAYYPMATSPNYAMELNAVSGYSGYEPIVLPGELNWLEGLGVS
jgi:RHS repeat-associated protein